MTELRKVRQEDFEELYFLFLGFGKIIKSKWEQLFFNKWTNAENCKGYVLVDKDRLVGYYSLLFSKRTIEGKTHRFCNWGNWIIKKEYRSSSMSMIFPLIRLKGYNITVFTPNSTVRSLLEKLGYDYINDSSLVIPSIPSLKVLQQRCTFLWGTKAMTVLDNIDKKIFLDHFSFLCSHVTIFDGNSYSYIVMTKIKKGRWPLARIHYISNVDLFLKYLDRVKISFSKKLSVVGIQVDSRIFKDYNLSYTFKRNIGPIMVKTSSISESQIDTLYSEEVLLR